MAQKQLSFDKIFWKHRFTHGGSLRNLSKGRSARPLSPRDPLHLVFKINKGSVKGGLRSFKSQRIIKFLFRKYAQKFFVKVEQFSIQTDHIHLIVRAPRRRSFQSFFRVIAGQIAQIFHREGLLKKSSAKQTMTDTPISGTGLWKYRPFTRVMRGWKAYHVVQEYVRLNELEATGHIQYQKRRLRGLSLEEWRRLQVL